MKVNMASVCSHTYIILVNTWNFLVVLAILFISILNIYSVIS
jgi:hypothetical protein